VNEEGTDGFVFKPSIISERSRNFWRSGAGCLLSRSGNPD